MGEFHPAERKVVVEFSPRDLGLTEVQQVKLTKLAGARYNPEKEVIRIGCDMFDHQAQNKRYLGDLVQKLITEARVCIFLLLSSRNIPTGYLRRFHCRTPKTRTRTFRSIPAITRLRSSPSSPRSGG